MAMKVLIVGGVAGGASAAARLRRMNEDAHIILFEKGEHISFANCGLPYYIGDVIKEKEKLVVQTPEAMQQRFRIDVRVRNEVKRINVEKKEVEVLDIASGKIYTESYDKLILSPGAEPVKPKLQGIESPRIFTLRNIPDTYKVRDFVDERKPQRAIIVGAGFIGLEVAENLHARGVKVTVVELADHVIGPLDPDMAAIVHQHLKDKHVELYLNDGVKNFTDVSDHIRVELSSGKLLDADMVIMGIGVKPESRLAKEAGLAVGQTGGILVDAHMRTSNSDIYAVGDAVEVKDFVSGNAALIPLAGPANKQGRIAANHICGIEDGFKGTQGTSIVKIFDLTVALTGNNERQLQKNGMAYEKSYTHSGSHASYYPGAIPLSIKLLFSKENGKILGAQVVGYVGVDKRTDVLATAIRAGMTVYDLEELELSYAPPFSSAKDPVNMAGYTAANILNGHSKIFHWHDVDQIDRSHAVLLDVRTAAEFTLGTIPGAINIPLDALRERMEEIPRDKDVFIFCQVGLRGYLAYRILVQNGYTRISNLSGGYKTYNAIARKQSNEEVHTYSPKEEIMQEKECCCDKKENNHVTLDACGLQCPGPIMKVFQAMKDAAPGQVLTVRATDPGFPEDIKAWCAKTGNRLLHTGYEGSYFSATLEKGEEKDLKEVTVMSTEKHDKTLIVFSNDLDRTIASFIIANGAAAMGRKVTMFFTFWGLNILRKPEKVKVKKDFFGSMFGMMMPRGSQKLTLSKMSMGGMGGKMIRYLMKQKNVDSLEELIAQARANGVRLVACNMSMDIMGIKAEELMDGVEIGGVATFLGSAEDSDTNLFI